MKPILPSPPHPCLMISHRIRIRAEILVFNKQTKSPVSSQKKEKKKKKRMMEDLQSEKTNRPLFNSPLPSVFVIYYQSKL